MNKRQILAGTAIGLLMAGGPAMAMTLPRTAALTSGVQRPIITVQDTTEDGAKPAPEGDDQQPKRKNKREKQEQSGQAQSDNGGQAAEGDQPRKKRRNAEADTQDAAAPAVDQTEADQPRKKRKQAEEQTQDAAPAVDEQADQPRKKKRKAAEAQAETVAPAAEDKSVIEQPGVTTQTEQPRKKKRDKQKAAEEQNGSEPAVTEEPAKAKVEEPAKAKAEEPAKAKAEEPAQAQDQAVPGTDDQGGKKKKRDKAEGSDQAVKPAETEPVLPKTDDAATAPKTDEAAPAAKTGEVQPPTDEQGGDRKKRDEKRKAEGDQQPKSDGTTPNDPTLPANAAPVLDSAKEKPAEAGDETGRKRKREASVPEAPAGPPPQSDAAAQKERIDPSKIEKADAEKGKRIDDGDRERNGERRDRPEGADVVRKFGDRVIIKFGDNVTVESSDRPRLSRNAKDVYYEQLPQGREREVIERPDGTRVVTVRNKYGDVVRRSRIGTDGREYVLNYVDERDYDRVRDWRDPGDDLPPIRLTIPADEYILDSDDVGADDEDRYYDFLDKPPVEQIQRTYSIDEVKRSARIRDTVRRIDLDTISFAFGSADVADDQVDKLDGVAKAMEKLLKTNPGETFLIEGHTDAVGSDEANLALSDRRAESVAGALSNVFGIPPENLTTQGYGEQYLKIKTQGPEEKNRRVAIRRVTALVAPVASNE